LITKSWLPNRGFAQLITTADDGAVSEGLDIGLAELAKQGILSRISAFANYGLLEKFAQTIPSETSIGLHINLSSGAPVLPNSQVASLVDSQGRFWRPSLRDDGNIPLALSEFYNSVLPRYDPEEIILEVNAQVEVFRRATHRLPDFVNYHHDLDKHPKIASALTLIEGSPLGRQRLLAAGKLSAVKSVFLSSDDSFASGLAKVLHMIDSAITASVRADGVPAEIVVHPGKVNDGLSSFTIYTMQRQLELGIWMSSEVKQVFGQATRDGEYWRFGSESQ